MRIDAHHHFWQYNQAKHSWISDEMAVLKQDFLPEVLKTELDQHEITATVVVQADQSEEENDFLLGCAKRANFIKGVVGWVDLKAPDVEERLAAYSESQLMKGFRHVVQDEPDPEFILDKRFQKGLGQLQKFDFTYDILIYPHQMPAALKTVQQHPDQKFVIDHIAKPEIKKQQFEEWATYIKAFGEHENVYCKVSGMVTEADWHNWRHDDFAKCLDVVFESFGPRRIMYGSDWPVCLLAASYDQVIGIITEYIKQLSLDEQKQVMGSTAMEFYNIKVAE